MSEFPFSEPGADEPESVHTAWRIARSAWERERKARRLLTAVSGRVQPATRKYLEAGVAYAERYSNDAATELAATLLATRRAEPRAIPA